MSEKTLQSYLTDLLNSRTHSKGPHRLLVVVPLDTPAQFARDLVKRLSELERFELHLAGPEEVVQAHDDYATLHPAYQPEKIDETVGNLITSGGIELTLMLSDPRFPDRSAVERLAPSFGDSRSLAGVALVHPDKLGRPLLLADTEVHDNPDEEASEKVVNKALDAARRLGIDTPRAALLAAVEVASPGLPVTVQAEAVADRFAQRDDCYVQGPLSMDLAISELAAQKKKATGEVAGKADVLVAPNLTVARGVRDAFVFGSGVSAASAIVGGAIPVALAQRGTGVDGALASALFAAALVERR